MTVAATSGAREFVEETVGDVDRHLERLSRSLARLPKYGEQGLSTIDVEALRINLLDKADRWLDCRLALTAPVTKDTTP